MSPKMRDWMNRSKVKIVTTSIAKILSGWSGADLGNLGNLLGLNGPAKLAAIEDRLKWLYYSRAGAKAETMLRNIVTKLFSKAPQYVDSESLRKTPSYEELIHGACEHMNALEQAASLKEQELFLSLAVIISALQGMKSRQRVEFFRQNIDLRAVAKGTNIDGANLSGPATTLAVLGAAQASGFGVYFASTTALGFLTHAIGVTLPFAVYTGLSSSIAFLIGPAGWLTAGAWGVYKLAQTEYKTIIPALIYIIARNSRDAGAA